MRNRILRLLQIESTVVARAGAKVLASASCDA